MAVRYSNDYAVNARFLLISHPSRRHWTRSMQSSNPAGVAQSPSAVHTEAIHWNIHAADETEATAATADTTEATAEMEMTTPQQPLRPIQTKGNRVAPMPLTAAQLAQQQQQQALGSPSAARNSPSPVFSGRPDEATLHNDHHLKASTPTPGQQPLHPSDLERGAAASSGAGLLARSDEDAPNGDDAAVHRSKFHRQRSVIEHNASSHRMELLFATFNLLLHLATILTDLMLISDYSQNHEETSAVAIAVIRILVGLVELEFDYLNRGWANGKWIWIPLIFCNGRILLEYARYVRSWWKHRQQPWANSTFRATVSFETFIGSLPLLIVQTYVLMNDDRDVQQIWIVAYVLTCMSIGVDLLNHYKYVSVDNSIYAAQFCKALVSVGMRTVLVAQLLITIGRVLMAWAFGSFLFGVAIYCYSVRWARTHGRDDPFAYGAAVSHITFGGLVAATLMFSAIPFAPSHSVYDWWIGYLLCEFKMAVENFVMLAVVLVRVSKDYDDSGIFYSIFAFTAACYIANLCACWFIHQHVRRQLNARNFYSDTAIVRLFANNLDYYRRAWKPESIESHGSAQNHLLYRDQSMKVHAHLQDIHRHHLERTASINQIVSSNPLAPKHSPQGSREMDGLGF